MTPATAETTTDMADHEPADPGLDRIASLRSRSRRPAQVSKVVAAGASGTLLLGLTAAMGWQARTNTSDTPSPTVPPAPATVPQTIPASAPAAGQTDAPTGIGSTPPAPIPVIEIVIPPPAPATPAAKPASGSTGTPDATTSQSH